MKQVFLLLVFSLALATITGCKENNSKPAAGSVSPAKETTLSEPSQDSLTLANLCTESGSGNLIIEKTEGEYLIKHFADYYKSPVSNPQALRSMKSNHWVNSCIIYALEKLFTRVESLDGVRLIFVALPTTPVSYSIVFVPTVFNPVRQANGYTGHTEKWGLAIEGSDCASGTTFFLDRTTTGTWSENFGRLYRGRATPTRRGKWDALSKEIWINKCVIKSMAAILKANRETTEGININMAAYDKRDATRWFQDSIHQSTVIFVAAGKDADSEGNRRNVWEATESLVSMLKKQNKWNIVAYNHGELCPNACD